MRRCYRKIEGDVYKYRTYEDGKPSYEFLITYGIDNYATSYTGGVTSVTETITSESFAAIDERTMSEECTTPISLNADGFGSHPIRRPGS